MRLSQHFTLGELTASATAAAKGIDNTPPVEVIRNLSRLAKELERIRKHVFGGKPLRINSGYRSPALNTVVGGSAKSLHLDGCAADFDPPAGMTHDRCQWLIAKEPGITYDLILEEGTVKPESEGGSRWIHFQIARPREPARRLVLDATVDRLGGKITRTEKG